MRSSVMTPLQNEILHFLYDNGLGERGFYFTGGTALCEFYLPYRMSDDLDFFVDNIDLIPLLEWVSQCLSDCQYKAECKKKNPTHTEIVVTGNESLVLHFSTHPQPKMAPFNTFGNVVVDSLEDIAVNKVTCLAGRDEPKDAFDLFYIISHTRFTFDYLLNRAKEKVGDFDDEENIINFAASKMLNVPVVPIPRLIEKVDPNEVKAFFKQIAIDMINRYRPKTRK